jgi:hypothetical protein
MDGSRSWVELERREAGRETDCLRRTAIYRASRYVRPKPDLVRVEA